MHFFNTVKYSAAENVDNSWCSRFETAADLCRAPGRWVAALWDGGTRYRVVQCNGNYTSTVSQEKESKGVRKVLRVTAGIFLALPGALLALPLMGLAYLNREIRLKHAITQRQLTAEEQESLKQMINCRQRLQDQKQGCEPLSCFLCSMVCIVSLLCVIACK